jgi:hypothetical protein
MQNCRSTASLCYEVEKILGAAREASVNEIEYLTQIASLTGLRHYPKQGPWAKKSGCAIGTRDGYVTAIGIDRSGREVKLAILLRFKKSEAPGALNAAVTQHPAVAQRKQGTFAAVGPDFLRWQWKYSFTKPKPEDVAGLTDALRDALKQNTQGFDGKCEKCHSVSTPDLTLQNGVPMYICSSCQQQTQIAQDQAARDYEAITPNYPNGILLGIAAALLGGVAWGLVAYGLNRIFLWGAILIGYAIAWGVVKGTKKVTLFGQVIIPILTLASVILGDTLFFVLTVMKVRSVPFSQQLFLGVLTHLWGIEVETNGIFSSIFALVGAVAALYQARKPKFRAAFEKLAAPTA